MYDCLEVLHARVQKAGSDDSSNALRAGLGSHEAIESHYERPHKGPAKPQSLKDKEAAFCRAWLRAAADAEIFMSEVVGVVKAGLGDDTVEELCALMKTARRAAAVALMASEDAKHDPSRGSRNPKPAAARVVAMLETVDRLGAAAANKFENGRVYHWARGWHGALSEARKLDVEKTRDWLREADLASDYHDACRVCKRVVDADRDARNAAVVAKSRIPPHLVLGASASLVVVYRILAHTLAAADAPDALDAAVAFTDAVSGATDFLFKHRRLVDLADRPRVEADFQECKRLKAQHELSPKELARVQCIEDGYEQRIIDRLLAMERALEQADDDDDDDDRKKYQDQIVFCQERVQKHNKQAIDVYGELCALRRGRDALAALVAKTPNADLRARLDCFEDAAFQ
jgi:hypothetical protein